MGEGLTMRGFPFGWIGFVVLMMCLSSVMRAVFGGWRRWDGTPVGSRRLRRRDRAGREDVERLDAEIAQRDQVIEDLQQRLSEVESRLDFTERLLAERANAARLDPVAVSSAQQ
jgi:hypothetical protein